MSKKEADKSPYYYFENGLLVMTEKYHLERGVCCGNGCRHCPYDHVNVKKEIKGNDKITKK